MQMSRILTVLIIAMLVSLTSCQTNPSDRSESLENSTVDTPTTRTILRDDFQALLDSVGLEGSILIYNPKADTYYSNDFVRAEVGFIPASTFKIPNSLIGLETGVIDESTVFEWDGQERWLKSWDRDHNLESAYRVSCVWCYQELARKIGPDRMRSELDQIGYHGMVFDSTSIDTFWLEGESTISQMSQIAFLQGLYQKELDIKESTYESMRDIMLFEEKSDFSIRAKTGMSADDGGGGVGWFVGFVERGDSVAYFATNLSYEGEADMSTFPGSRIDLSKNALGRLGWLD